MATAERSDLADPDGERKEGVRGAERRGGPLISHWVSNSDPRPSQDLVALLIFTV